MLELVDQTDGADLGAVAARGASVREDEAGLLADDGLEAALGSRKAFQASVGEEIDVQVPADLDQLG
ncbi:MAG: hypothetical protein MUF52_06540 [Syntrophobacteraceae bacterium]|jgi:hypothetical protein|nr:hypothetical protein [Syntrophobacteraceae bacterium]MCU0587798.1 hypothetical protein [Syntrophobacteraceae bacterium]